MGFIFKNFGKIFVSIFVASLLISVGTWAACGYVAVKLGPKALDAAEKSLESK